MSVNKGLLHPDNRPLLAGIGVGALVIGGIAYWYWGNDRDGRCAKGQCDKPCGSTTCAAGSSKEACVPADKGQHAHATKVVTEESKFATLTLPSSHDRVKRFKDLHLENFVKIKTAAIHDSRNNTLDYNTLVDIQNLALDITVRDVPQILKLNRERRRKVIDTNKKEYARIVKEGIDDINSLFNQNLNEILRDFGVSRDTYNAAVQLHSQADPTVVFTPADLLEIFVGRLESYNQPRENSHEYFANIYRDVQKRLKGLQLLAVDPELASEVRSSLILDTVQRETGLEEEDIRHWRGKFDSPELRIIDEEIATDIQQSKSK